MDDYGSRRERVRKLKEAMRLVEEMYASGGGIVERGTFMIGDEIHTIVTYESGLCGEKVDRPDGTTVISFCRKVAKRDENGDEYEDTEYEGLHIIDLGDDDLRDDWYELQRRMVEKEFDNQKSRAEEDGFWEELSRRVHDRKDDAEPEEPYFAGKPASSYAADNEARVRKIREELEQMKNARRKEYQSALGDALRKHGSEHGAQGTAGLSYAQAARKLNETDMRGQGFYFLMNADREKLDKIVRMIMDGKADGTEMAVVDDPEDLIGESALYMRSAKNAER